MAAALVIWGTGIRIGVRDFQLVFVYVVFVWMMEMAVMEIIDVISMLDCGVSAVRAVYVGVVGVSFAAHVQLLEDG